MEKKKLVMNDSKLSSKLGEVRFMDTAKRLEFVAEATC